MSFGPPPPPPRKRSRGGAVAVAVALRLLLAAVPVLTLGILAWVPLLRLAVARQRAADWAVFWAFAVASTGAFMLAGYTEDENDWQTNTGVPLLLLLAVASTGWFLYADTRGVPDPVAYGLPPQAPYPPHPHPHPHRQQ